MGLVTDDWSVVPSAEELFDLDSIETDRLMESIALAVSAEDLRSLAPGPIRGAQGPEEGCRILALAIRRYRAMRGILMAFDAETEEEVPQAAIDASRRALERMRLIAAFLKKSSGQATYPIGQLKQFADEVRTVAAQVAQEVRPHLRRGIADLASVTRDAQQAYDSATAAEERVKELEQRAQVIIDRVGVGRLAGHYETEAKGQAAVAKSWLVGVSVAGGLLVVVVGWLVVETLIHGGTVRWEQLSAILGTKALAIGVLSYAVSFCSRNYRAHRHMEATYRQRMAALDTYALMASSLADDNAGRAIVLTELAKAVFAGTDTGLTSTGSGDKTLIENTVPIVSAARGTG